MALLPPGHLTGLPDTYQTGLLTAALGTEIRTRIEKRLKELTEDIFREVAEEVCKEWDARGTLNHSVEHQRDIFSVIFKFIEPETKGN